MFTGIIEAIGEVVEIQKELENIHFTIKAAFTNELKIDQSIAHNGCCLTVVAIQDNSYTVTAIKETLNKTNLQQWVVGTKVNLERCMQLGGRLDGHIVQGHIDSTATCVEKVDMGGSTKFTFSYDTNFQTVPKGSVTVNGVSLTVVDSLENSFSVCIIPFTLDHTNFHTIEVGDVVNLEFDIIGKYVARLMGQTKA